MKGLTFFLLFLTGRTADGSLLTYPTDRTATFGERVILDCATDLDYPVYWYFNGHEIFYGGKVSMSFQAMFSVSSSKTGEYNLVISSADTSYNGLYACGDDEGQGERKSAHLYVTDPDSVTAVVIHSATSSDSYNQAIIIVVVVGSIVLLLTAAIIIAVVCVRRNRANENRTPSKNPNTESLLPSKATATLEESEPQSNIDHTALELDSGEVLPSKPTHVPQLPFQQGPDNKLSVSVELAETSSEADMMIPLSTPERTNEQETSTSTADVKQHSSVLGPRFGQNESDGRPTPSATPEPAYIQKPILELISIYEPKEADGTPSATPGTT